MARTTYRGVRRTLSTEEVMQIRRRLIESTLGRLDFGGIAPLNKNALESAVARQNTGFGENMKYNRPHELAASLFYGIAMNHSFENGNKRTALVSALVSLKFNNAVLCDTSQDDLYEMATRLVAHDFPLPRDAERTPETEVAALGSWLRSRTRRPEKLGDKAINMRELRPLLEARGCTFEQPSKNFVRISREGRTIKTGYPRESFTVGIRTVKEIRKKLDLKDIDSSEFYDINFNVDNFVHEYSEVLTRLADA
ncbi:type II toxin-antitoxin system death-on-curing family toxin [Rhodococcus pyridinivorans]|uniref:type II toxin-antitoxin system death-on-curing family toxin n=1 Tax=Rhodococcus pyridinivorans TaxID=103816 RepID=UPI002284777D|nr:type II toxin-antitoxin system death-on-curing family toxin [Rhodococcus pyridinivorans]WAL44881.1 type II toxin-antitoxin system death-on-curing family toxin [Rhodococcus pyridinivorans]